MNEQIAKGSWILAALFVLGGVLGKFGIDIVGVQHATNYFHVANTALLFGILFSLQSQKKE
ncbi:MAG: hypothetical protein V3U24_09245 [Candidatus Neomarinimicrobiota bacterium]